MRAGERLPMSDGTDLDFADEPSAPPAPKPPKRKPRAETPPPDAEHFENITPFPKSRQAAAVGRELPHSLEAEEALIGSCLVDGAEVIGKCLKVRVGPESFHDPKHAIIFECLIDLYHRNAKIIDTSVLAEELKTRKQIDQVGGYAFISQVSSRIPTTAQAEFFIEKVREQALLREVINAAERAKENAYNFTGGIDDFIDETTSRLASVVNNARRAHAEASRPITSFSYPVDDDPNVLLGSDDYLGRGGGMLFVSHAGAGKSSFIMDACMSWAIGDPWMGIKCNGPLKSLIIQAEDSDRYIGKVVESFAFAKNLTPERHKQLSENVIVVRMKGTRGTDFFSRVSGLVAKHRPDLVVINPLYLYAEGNISDANDAGAFLTELDRLNRDQCFGWVLIHHSGKPQQKSPNGKRAELDDWETIYMGFGSSYLANWPRCSALLEPVPKENGKFWLKLGKGGSNAGVVRQIPQGTGFRLEAVTRIAIKHSTQKMPVGGRDRQVIFWELDAERSDQSTQTDGGTAARTGRPAKYFFRDYLGKFRLVCAGHEKRLNFSALWREAHQVDGISQTQFRTVLRTALEDGDLTRSDDSKYYLGLPGIHPSDAPKTDGAR